MLKVVLAKSYDAATGVINNSTSPWVAIETEYGSKSVQGEVTLNHHGDMQGQDAPALAYKKKIRKRYDNFLISHIDLDVLFGILWTAGWLKETVVTKGLSNLVALADVNGFHTIKPILDTMPKDIQERYYAIGYLVNSWVINDNGKLKKDISREVHKLLLRLKDIILNGATKEQIALYKQWFREQEKAAKVNLREIREIGDGEKLFVFRAPFSLTTAYDVGDIKASVIVQYNEQSKSISLGCFDIKIAQEYFGKAGVLTPIKKYFGEDAGGKYTIAGTSRSHDIQPEMLDGFIEFLHREYFNTPEVIEVAKQSKLKSRRIISLSNQELIAKYADFDLAGILQETVET